MNVLERWFAELDIAWVLHLPDADGDDASAELHHTSADVAKSWIRGLHRILEAIRSTPTVFLGLPDQIHFARFTKETMSKMLPFVDFAIRQVVVCTPYKKLLTMLGVYEALSDATNKIWGLFDSIPEGAYNIMQETVSLVSAKKEEAGEAIWSTMEPIRTRLLESIDAEYVDGSSSSLIPQASSDIHKATLPVMEYIIFLDYNSSSMYQIVSKAVCLGKYVPQITQEGPLDSMIMDTVSCPQDKLVKMSESFPDQGLRFLFLLNNFEFIWQRLMDNHLLWLHPMEEVLSEKVEGYMENYLQACWEPVFSCLFSPIPLCFGTNHSPLLKFESEFMKMYATQKLWKVPDPVLRNRLRTAIINKIVPWYT